MEKINYLNIGLFKSIQFFQKNNIDFKKAEKIIWDNFGKTSTIMFLDSTGFTRISKKHGIVHFLFCLNQMRELLTPIFKEFESSYFKVEADNIFAEFKTSDNAFLASQKANLIINKKKIQLSENEYFSICIGIGYGKVLQSNNEWIYGEEVNLASILGEDTAKGGEILLTESAYNKLNIKFKNDFIKKELEKDLEKYTYYSFKK